MHEGDSDDDFVRVKALLRSKNRTFSVSAIADELGLRRALVIACLRKLKAKDLVDEVRVGADGEYRWKGA